MKQYNYPKGKLGEEIAANYLHKKGYKLVEQNFHTRYGEIDLICQKNKNIIFVEVKLKIGEQFGTPEEMVNKRKVNQVMCTAESFLQKNSKYRELNPRIDVVAVVLNEDKTVDRINHYENVTFD